MPASHLRSKYDMSEHYSFYEISRLIRPDRLKACDPVLMQAWYDGVQHRARLLAAEIAGLQATSPHIFDAPWPSE